MKDLFNSIQELCESILFVPFHELRELELTNWWGANLVTWAFIGVGVVAFLTVPKRPPNILLALDAD